MRRSPRRMRSFGLVSHELRTPLTTILGNSEILSRRGGTLGEPALREIAADIHGEAIRLNRIVSDLLTFVHLDGDEAEREPVALQRLVEYLIRDYRRTSSREIAVHNKTAELIALGDEKLIGQVVFNYLSNAEKHSPAGTPLDIVVEREGDEARVRVLDRGIGVRPEEAARVFEPFFRSPDARATSGLGIGLSVCHRVVEAMGGRAWAAAREGGGSEFGFALPFHRNGSDPG